MSSRPPPPQFYFHWQNKDDGAHMLLHPIMNAPPHGMQPSSEFASCRRLFICFSYSIWISPAPLGKFWISGIDALRDFGSIKWSLPIVHRRHTLPYPIWLLCCCLRCWRVPLDDMRSSKVPAAGTVLDAERNGNWQFGHDPRFHCYSASSTLRI